MEASLLTCTGMWCFHDSSDDAVAPSSRHQSFRMSSIAMSTNANEIGNGPGQTKASSLVLGAYDAPPTWESDSAVGSCETCHTEFDLFNRKHHCRACGHVFCGTCASHFDKVIKYGLTSDVRLCQSCVTTARRENNFYESHFHTLQAGATFQKYGLLVERSVKVQLVGQSLQYQSIDRNTDVLSGEVKAILMESITNAAAAGVLGLHIATPSQQHRLDARTSDERDRWLVALQAALDIREYHKRMEEESTAARVAEEHQEMTRVMQGLESIELRKHKMQQMRLEKNNSRRASLRAKYGLNAPSSPTGA
ncbi:Aste57867_13734 [Aphanomyces stellatus]|uniref:Aste57867_13734 protein n=1 Tax=Aphanomyces stellatus TaxID=120398 RepID=A0A485KZS9_9STRA|nr:hypothetical protein As57867_013684 [Aphanomyces stellatus]VFT90567.1 Aste57867_13734 [Aphanomyces stellatus]